MNASLQTTQRSQRSGLVQAFGSWREFDKRVRSLPLGMPVGALQRGRGPLARLMRSQAMHPVFQPIACLGDGSIYAHEALIRGASSTDLYSPDAMFAAAAAEGLNFEFEAHCVAIALNHWGATEGSARLFVNISAKVLVQIFKYCGRDVLVSFINGFGVLPRHLVLEITEHERVTDMDELASVVEVIRSAGTALALDDFGDGRSSLRLWSQLKPEVVKIDKYFTKDLSNNGDKLKTVQALQQIAAIFHTQLIAEGVETEADLRVLRDLGIPYGQGYFLGRPTSVPEAEIAILAKSVMFDRRVAVFPEVGCAPVTGYLNPMAVIDAPAIDSSTTNDDIAAIFLSDPRLHALAVVAAGIPIGLINRANFMNEYSRMYYREVWGRKSGFLHANTRPRLIERNHNVDELIGILTSDDQRYLTDGFIVTENGRYVGLGTGDQLVRSVTETRINAARHANPLTFLPGNIPISHHIERLLQSGVEFVACYADLNNFKPFNDQYGYWRGDEMIRLVAKLAVAHCDPLVDFVGHVGGDDFILLYQSVDWQNQCQQIVSKFALAAVELFDEPAQLAGGIQAEDRHGVLRFFPLTTLSIGAVRIRAGDYTNAEQVASVAARAKHDAKTSGEGLAIRQKSEAGVGC